MSVYSIVDTHWMVIELNWIESINKSDSLMGLEVYYQQQKTLIDTVHSMVCRYF